MAKALSVGDTMIVTIVTGAGDDCFNRLAYEITALTAGTPTDLTFVEAFDTAIEAHWKAALGNNTVYRGVFGTLRKFGEPTPYARVEQTANSGAGAFGSNMVSAQTAGLIAWLTPRSGRAERGRLYMPGVPQTAVASDEHPSTAYKNALSTIAADILNFTSASASGNTASCQFCLRNKAGTLTVVTSFAVRPKWATQKRRGDYGRPSPSPI